MQITENELDRWVASHSVEARGILAGLIARLIAASCPSAKLNRFPDEDSIGQHGSDGELDTEDGAEPYIPVGHSFWEFGIGNPGDKATEDYKKATADIPSEIRTQSTFVFVTPRSSVSAWSATWEQGKQKDWIETRKKKGEWQDIRVIDGTQLTAWINSLPAIREWLMIRMEHPSAGAESIETHWQLVQAIGSPPPLRPELFLSNRSEALNKIDGIFKRSMNKLQLGTRYPSQLKDLVSAYIVSLDIGTRREIAGRTLIIENRDIYKRAINLTKPHILVLPFEIDEADRAVFLQRAINKSHQVIYPGPIGGNIGEHQVSVQNPTSHQVEQALVNCGYKSERARKLAHKIGGNLGALLNLLSEASEFPQWSRTPEVDDLVIAEFIGAWRNDVEGDVKAIETIAGKSYGEWIGNIQLVKNGPNSPLRQTDCTWKFLERFEGWYSLGRYVSLKHLELLADLAIKIFRETNDKINDGSLLMVTSRPEGNLSNSSTFRLGISESVALLGTHPQAISGVNPEVAKNYARKIVRDILAENTWQNWATLNHLLPNLAEAAPSEFLNAVENAINRGIFESLFDNEGDGIIGTTHISGLLWGLEALAWDQNLFMRSVQVLAQLAEIDPGGKFANRPLNTLVHIFLPWLPQTTASLDQKVTALQSILKNQSYVGLKLLISLLPESVRSSSGTHRPNWRDSIPDNWSKNVTTQSFVEQTSKYTSLLVSHVTSTPEHIVDVVDNFNVLSPGDLETILKTVHSSSSSIAYEAKLKLWEELSAFVRRHRRFATADWAIDEESRKTIEEAIRALEPTKPTELYRSLFGNKTWDYFDEKLSYEEQRTKLNDLQEKAANEIFEQAGLLGLTVFVCEIENPGSFGYALGRSVLSPIDTAVLLLTFQNSDQKQHTFAEGFFAGRFSKFSWKWFDALDINTYTEGQKGKLLSFLPFNKETWDRVDTLLGQSEKYYWSITGAHGYHIGDLAEFAASKLLEHSRPLDAIRVLQQAEGKSNNVNTSLAIAALTAFIQKPESLGNNMDTYSLTELIKKVQDDPQADELALGSIEWSLLLLLDRHHGGRPKTLERRLAKDASFFCHVLEIAYRASSDNSPRSEKSNEEIALATNAYRLLDSWTRVPGTNIDGTFDGNQFKNWYENVKALSSNSERLEVAQITLGRVLRFAPTDPSGLWLHKDIATILDAKDAEHLRSGYQTGLFNARGIFWVDPEGKEEMNLANAFREKSRALDSAGFSRIAETLEQLASGYEAEAKNRIRQNRMQHE